MAPKGHCCSPWSDPRFMHSPRHLMEPQYTFFLFFGKSPTGFILDQLEFTGIGEVMDDLVDGLE